MAVLPPFSAGRLATEAQVDVGLAVLLVLAGGLYVLGVRRLAERGRPWPLGRSVAFAAGLAVVAVATQSGLAAYDTTLFAAHVTQHLLLGMVGPLLLVVGAPVTLALQAAHRPTQVALVAGLHHPVARALAHPLVAVALFAGSLLALYLSPLYALSLANDAVHVALHLHFLAAGLLFFVVVLGVEPAPWPLGHPARLGLVLLTVPLHALLGIVLLTSDDVLAAGHYEALGLGWVDPLGQQRLGGGLLWAVGDLFAVAVVLVLMVGWMADDQRQATRADRRAEGRHWVPA